MSVRASEPSAQRRSSSPSTVGRKLSPEQRALVYALTTDGNGVDVVFGAAGTGKTTALGLARSTWESAGLRVAGCALAARAAAQLREGAGIESWTIEKLLLDTARDGGRLGVDVLVVDECGMVGTRKLAPMVRWRPLSMREIWEWLVPIRSASCC